MLTYRGVRRGPRAVIRVISDVGKNRIVFELSGRPTTQQVLAATHELRLALPRLRSPIDIITDVSQLESLEDVDPTSMTDSGALIQSVGVRRAVRVVGRSKDGALQFQRATKHFNHSAHLAFSREEAEQVLAQR